MSLILDALRKSEAERRRGQAPDLYAELPPVTRRSRGVAQPWWWLAGALALVALLAWALSQRSPAPMTAATSSEISNVDPQPNGVEDRVAQRLDNPPASSLDVPAAVVAAPPLAGGTEVVGVPTDIVITPPSQQSNPYPGPVVPATREANNAAPPAGTFPPATSPPVPATARAQPAPAPASPLPASPASATPVNDANAPIALSDLSAGERQQLQPLKVSMHLWDSNPAGRFAIIDGTRVGEGDRIGDAVVESITRDGLVLAWNGRRLRLGIR